MRRLIGIVSALTLGLFGLTTALVTPALAEDSSAGQLVSGTPAGGTPHVLNGRVYSVEQEGSTIVLGGTFTSAMNNNGSAITRNRLLAFNANNGQISTTFNPSPNGTINAVIPSGDGETVYVGGSFSSIGGVARTNVARIRVSDGSVVTAFNAGAITGQVKDLRLKNGRLWIGGGFTHVQGRAQAALATLNPTTGAYDSYMSMTIAGIHNNGFTTVSKMDITPDGSRLAAVGNFDTLDGVKRHQMFMLDLGGAAASAADFKTTFYETRCSLSFDSYMRDVDISPNGKFLVISTTGAYGGSTASCDTTARFETESTGSAINPSWVNHTGGDTTYAVEITPSGVVYVGGHQRWQNNPFAGDRAGQGAVSRPGIAALDPINGLPFSWNPTRTRGVGVFDLLFNSQGLWVASDTDRIGEYVYKGRIALMPTNGSAIPPNVTPTLPNDIYVASPLSNGSTVGKRSYENNVFGSLVSVSTGGRTWNNLRGAFMLRGNLYTAWADGTFTRQSFNGSTYGNSMPVNTADLLVTLTDWRSDIAAMTSLFFDSGRLYFTRTGSSQLFYRHFTPESDVVGARRFVASNNVSGIDFSQVRGMFTTGEEIYWSDTAGRLRKMGWEDGPLSDTPVPGTATQISGPGVDGNNWAARSLFLYQDSNGDGASTTPVASFSEDCVSLTCEFDASTSSAPGSTITSYAWNFGDGSTGSGVAPNHTFTAAGDHDVTLTVTNSQNQTSSVTRTVSVTKVNQAPVASFTASCTLLECAVNASGSSDPDGDPLTYSWDFGDGSNGTGITATRTYTTSGPRTITLTVSDGTLTNSTTRSVNPSDGQTNLTHVGAASTNGNRINHTVAVPNTVQAGDTLVLFLTVNAAETTTSPPAGWTQLQTTTYSGTRAWAWTKQATASDAGSTVSIPSNAYTKSALSITAYRAAAGTSSVTSSAVSTNGAGTNHTTPSVAITNNHSWLISYWSEKSSTTATWSTPASVTERTSTYGTAAGRTSAVTADSNGPVNTGTAGNLTATTNQSVGRSINFSIIISAE